MFNVPGKTKMMLGGACAAVVGMGLLASPAAQADPITFYFSGTVDYLSDSTGVLDGSVAVGDTFSGQYTFNSAATDYNPYGPLAQYPSAGAAYQYTVDVGDYTFSRSGDAGWPGIEIHVQDNNAGEDGYNVNAQGDVTASPAISGGLNLQSDFILIDHDLNAFDSTDLPLTPPSLAAFNGPNDLNAFEVLGFPSTGGSPIFSIGGALTRLADTPDVPEPASLVLLALGGAGLLLRRARREATRK